MKGGSDYIVWGILGKLAQHGRIEGCPQEKGTADKPDGWRLTDAGFQSRRDDS